MKLTTAELTSICALLAKTYLPEEHYVNAREALKKMQHEIDRRDSLSKISAHMTPRQVRGRRNG